jgi:hypothetical protein
MLLAEIGPSLLRQAVMTPDDRKQIFSDVVKLISTFFPKMKKKNIRREKYSAT